MTPTHAKPTWAKPFWIATFLMLLAGACTSTDTPTQRGPVAVEPAGDAVIPAEIPTLTVGDTRALVFGSQLNPENGEPTTGFSEMESADQWGEVLVVESSSYDAVMSTAVLPSRVSVWLMDELDDAGEPGPPVLVGECNIFAPGETRCEEGEPTPMRIVVAGNGTDPVTVTIEPPADLDWTVAMVQSDWLGPSRAGRPPSANVAWFFMVGDCAQFC